MINIVEFEAISSGEVDLDNYTGLFTFKDGTHCWYKNGRLHCDDGPAWVFQDGKSWWVNGVYIYKYTHKGDYLVIEDGLPCEIKWLGQSITQKKVLTSSGIMFLPNLPGM